MKRGFWFIGLIAITFAIIISACSSGFDQSAEETAVVQTLALQIVQARFATQAAETQAAVPAMPTVSPTQASTVNASPTADIPRLPEISEVSCIPAGTKREFAQVVNVVDGDTIDVEIDGDVYQLRYIGMDAPERGMAFSDQATQVNRQLVEGKQVLLVMDISETDTYDRLLRYVIVGDRFVNYEMVRQGFASAVAYEPDTACNITFVQAQQLAISAGFGFWVPTATFVVNEFSVQSTQPVQPSGCDPSYPTVCIHPPPPDLDCGDISDRRFQVNPPDPHRFDGDHDGIGCES